MDLQRLNAIIRERGDSIRMIAKAGGVGATMLGRKLAGKAPFNAREIAFLKKRFNLSPEETVAIFVDFAADPEPVNGGNKNE